MVIVPEEAKVIRKIFDLYLSGKTLNQIKVYLESNDIKNSSGGDIWYTATIDDMLSNEKYAGDSIMQKTYVEDFLTKKKVKNRGQKEKYYIKDSHQGIISREIFEKTQNEKERRKRITYKSDGSMEYSKTKYRGQYDIGNILVCGYCGAGFRRRTERGKVVWRCATRVEKGRDACPESPTLKDEEISEKIRNDGKLLVYKDKVNIYN
jgi:site-specific DNA recombinase